jgi:hypothetical protein
MLGVPGLVPGAADQVFVGRRFDSDGLLKQAIEQLAPGTGSATIEAKSELVQVVRQMIRTDSTLVSPQQRFVHHEECMFSILNIQPPAVCTQLWSLDPAHYRAQTGIAAEEGTAIVIP